jgi:hypothetical protein
MKQDGEVLNALSLHFFQKSLTLHRRTVTLSLTLDRRYFFSRESTLNVPLLLLFQRNSLLNASSPLLLKATMPTSAFEVNSGSGREERIRNAAVDLPDNLAHVAAASEEDIVEPLLQQAGRLGHTAHHYLHIFGPLYSHLK